MCCVALTRALVCVLCASLCPRCTLQSSHPCIHLPRVLCVSLPLMYVAPLSPVRPSLGSYVSQYSSVLYDVHARSMRLSFVFCAFLCFCLFYVAKLSLVRLSFSLYVSLCPWCTLHGSVRTLVFRVFSLYPGVLPYCTLCSSFRAPVFRVLCVCPCAFVVRCKANSVHPSIVLCAFGCYHHCRWQGLKWRWFRHQATRIFTFSA